MEWGGEKPRRVLNAVVADGFHRAAFHGFAAEGFLGVAFGLLEDVAVPAVVIAGEVGWSSLAAEIAIDALIVDVILSFDVFGIFVSEVGHLIQGFF